MQKALVFKFFVFIIISKECLYFKNRNKCYWKLLFASWSLCLRPIRDNPFMIIPLISLITALEIAPNDPKALYRRCVANESLGKLEEAYKDGAMLLKIDPKNTSVKPILNRLTPIIRERVRSFCQINLIIDGPSILKKFNFYLCCELFSK